ncbi:hypothetical protein V8D89_008466 [Ganoderma adspersum]
MPLDPVVVFPLEIFEHIIDQSDDLDGSLSRPSLSCRAFLPRARRNLFFHIHIGHKEKLESAPSFLRTRPWLPLIVRCLTIRKYVKRDSFMLLAVVPAQLLAMLPHLRSLEFATDWNIRGLAPIRLRYPLAYKYPIPSLLHKLCTSIRHLELIKLQFCATVDFVQLLCALPSLRSLEPKSNPLEIAMEILSSMTPTQAPKYLKVVWPPRLLTALAFDLNASHAPLLRALEQSIIRLQLYEVVFSTACGRKNRRTLAASALYRAFPALGERGILRVTDRVLHPTSPRAVVLFVHGFAEHVAQYEWAQGVYAARGIAVFAFDQRGLGRTGFGEAHCSAGSAYCKTSFVDQFADIEWAVREGRVRMPGLPVFLMGHSMGGGLALAFAARVAAPSTRLRSRAPAQFIARMVGKLFPMLLVPAPVNSDQILTHDNAVNEAAEKDPLCPQTVSLVALETVLGGCERVLRQGYKRWPQNLPLLIVHGTADKVTSYAASRECFSQVEAQDKEFKSFEVLFPFCNLRALKTE